MLRGRGPQKPKIAYDIVRIYTFNIHTDLIECIVLGDTESPLLRCFLFTSKLQTGVIKTNGQYMNNQTHGNQEFGPLF